MINDRIEASGNTNQKKELQKLLVKKLQSKNLPMSDLVSSKLSKASKKDSKSIEDIIYEEALRVERNLGSPEPVLESKSAYDRAMFEFQPANENEWLPKHEQRKIASYEEYRQYMVKETRASRKFAQAIKEVEDIEN